LVSDESTLIGPVVLEGDWLLFRGLFDMAGDVDDWL